MKKKSKLKKKKRIKKQNKKTTQQSPRRFEPLYNEPRKHRLSGDQIYNI